MQCLKFVASNSEQCRKVEGLAALVVQWSFLLPSKGQELSLDPVLEGKSAAFLRGKRGLSLGRTARNPRPELKCMAGG